MALAKVLHFFCNTRFQDKLLVEIDTFLANKVRELFFFNKSQLPEIGFIFHVYMEVARIYIFQIQQW